MTAYVSLRDNPIIVIIIDQMEIGENPHSNATLSTGVIKAPRAPLSLPHYKWRNQLIGEGNQLIG